MPRQSGNSVRGRTGFSKSWGLRASVSTGLSSGLKHSSLFERAKIGASAKKCEKGKGKGEKETLARKPHDFEKPVRPRTEFPDWRGMEVLIAKW